MPSTRPCPLCGKEIQSAAIICRHCGEKFAPPAAEQTGDATGGVIPYKNVPALFAYYCGVFAILPCFPIGLAGLILGVIGLRQSIINPQVRGHVHAIIGIVLGGFFGLLWLGLSAIGVIGSVRL